MNKYVTILLVILTATGSEAQTFTTVLSEHCGGMKFEEMLSQEQLRALGTDIMAVLRNVRSQASDENDNYPYYNKVLLSARNCLIGFVKLPSAVIIAKPFVENLHFAKSSISIRGPNFSA